MAQEIGSGTNLGVDVDGDGKPDFHLTLKTVAMIVAAVFTLGSMYVKLQMDIDEAKTLPPASIDRTEYDLNHAWMMDHIEDLEQDVKDLRQHVETLTEKLYKKKDR
tara:strand:+ start:167 stop:484 length:318 start_codon:yes stop_codon:yes gene_type:complete